LQLAFSLMFVIHKPLRLDAVNFARLYVSKFVHEYYYYKYGDDTRLHGNIYSKSPLVEMMYVNGPLN
jgi:hypothetical protein